jgi:hypothetical protein
MFIMSVFKPWGRRKVGELFSPIEGRKQKPHTEEKSPLKGTKFMFMFQRTIYQKGRKE